MLETREVRRGGRGTNLAEDILISFILLYVIITAFCISLGSTNRF